MRVYISGAVTGTDDYKERFAEAEQKFCGICEVVNPVKVCDLMPKDFSHKDYMDVCLPILAKCDCIYMLAGWEESQGAKEELLYAKEHGIREW